MNQPSSFMITTIVAAYNMEKYLAEAIDSVLQQSIGFEEHVQLILVDDGSVDSTFAICKEYEERFPGNIIAITKDNGGVSSARNAGLRYATGKYVNFLDADDKWSLDAFAEAASFLETHPDVDIVTARHLFFGRKEGPHPLNYKYNKGNRVLFLESDWMYPQLSFSNAFVNRALFPDAPFDEKLCVSEDFLVMNKMLLNTKCYGVMGKPVYWYRKREDGSSAIDTTTHNISWYFDTPRYCYLGLIEHSMQQEGCVPLFIQASIMYDLTWRIRAKNPGMLTDDQLAQYKGLLVSILQYIEDGVILKQRKFSRAMKLYTFSLKHGIGFSSLRNSLCVEGKRVFCSIQDQRIDCWKASLETLVTIDFLEEKDDFLSIEGWVSSLFPLEQIRVVFSADEEERAAKLCPRVHTHLHSFFEANLGFAAQFSVSIPKRSFKVFVELGGTSYPARLKAGVFCPLSFESYDYAFLESVIMYCGKTRGNGISIKRPSLVWMIKRECLREKELKNEIRDASVSKMNQSVSSWKLLSFRRKAFFSQLRKMYFKGTADRIWLISDRVTLAGDNGEALFLYLCDNPVEGVTPIFAIKSDSRDFDRLKQYGKVVPYGSDEYKKAMLDASVIISSAGESNVTNAFGPFKFVFGSLPQPPYVFLQHGVTKDDLSSWINRWKKNISLFVTAADREADSIVNNPMYGYSEQNISRTGFPRHDKLIEEALTTMPKKRILIAPTWRKQLTNPYDSNTGTRQPFDGFTDSEFFRFYDALLNDKVLEKAAADHGYEIVFVLHPSFIQEAGHFRSSFAKIELECNYRAEFINSAIMVSDYSSVTFDFAMLKKPVVYAQFDADAFFSGHSYEKGYFDYERDGFGPVVYDDNSLIETLINLMENPRMGEIYEKRVDDFFLWPTESRCKLLVDRILELEKGY